MPDTPRPSRPSLPALLAASLALCLWGSPARATTFSFSTGDPDGKMAMASRPASAGKIEIEAADDFVLAGETLIDHATFTGLLPSGTSLTDVSQVRVEIYRVFPQDSDVGRTSGAPTFSTSQVPTRVNSPSDVAFDSRDSAAATLTFGASVLSASFTAANSVLNGIHPKPDFQTGGDGAVTGEEVSFEVAMNALDLPAGHYFFVPQVALSTSGDFFWLSAPKPITGGTGPFTPDLQTWIRNEDLDPDWLRVGTDIVGGDPAPTFNAAFSLEGDVVPEPSAGLLVASGIVGMALRRRWA